MTLHDLPPLNAALNATAAALITTGYVLIRLGRRGAHRACMLSAGVVSALFLISYVAHKVLKGAAASPGEALHTPFGGEGLIRYLYATMLLTHIGLAIALTYLVPHTFLLALRGDLVAHRRWARVTLPLWLYVSVTGVLVYYSLYRWWPAAG